MELVRVGFNSNADAILNKLAAFPANMREGLRREMDRQNRLTIQHVARTRLSYPRGSKPGLEGLRVITGNLRRGLVAGFIPAFATNQAVVGGIANKVRYAAIHEFGGTIPPRGKIYPRKPGGVLRFEVDGKVLFRKWVNQTKPIKIPARAPVTKGLMERLPVYRDRFSQVVLETFRGQ